MKSQGKKVFVGLSGGVDSAVSAALLKKQGFDVTGVFIKAWEPPFDSAQGTRKYLCGWKEDRRSAMRAAAILNISFITFDLGKEYKKEVVDYMIAEYKAGRTPNPDVMCNKEIKFGLFLKFALKNRADFIATGHYARNELRDMNYELWEGKDKNKDQSYFLWTLTQKQLKHILFPVGHLQKKEVRKLASEFGLPQAVRKDSQGLCFLGQIDMKEFLSRYIKTKKGDVLNENGELVGRHNGAVFYTIGERHGFTITKKTDRETPLYVVAKNIFKNTITVAPKIFTPISSANNSLAKYQGQVLTFGVKKVNWISGKEPNLSRKYLARIRYRQEKDECRIKIDSGKIEVIFDKPQTGVSPGQSVVFYDGEICLGGGIIQ